MTEEKPKRLVTLVQWDHDDEALCCEDRHEADQCLKLYGGYIYRIERDEDADAGGRGVDQIGQALTGDLVPIEQRTRDRSRDQHRDVGLDEDDDPDDPREPLRAHPRVDPATVLEPLHEAPHPARGLERVDQ